MMAENHL